MTPRADLLGPIHKELRVSLGDLLARLGHVTFAEPETATRIVEQLEHVLAMCEEHRENEDRFVLPTLEARIKGTLATVTESHTLQQRLVAELRALGETLVRTPLERRQVAGRTLYLHFSRFVGELLLHMADEEQMMQPLLERLLSADELGAIHDNLTVRR